MPIATNLGFPRIGPKRELKWALESFWSGKTDQKALLGVAANVRLENWKLQRKLGISHIPSNDFSLYDQVLDTTLMVGAIPSRYTSVSTDPTDLTTYFAMARGFSKAGEKGVTAMEMTKWFDTNYHYIVPELVPDQKFKFSSKKIIDEFLEAKAAGIHTRPVLISPVSYLLLSKIKGSDIDPLSLLDSLLPVYGQALSELEKNGADWVQIDEPSLGISLTNEQTKYVRHAYSELKRYAPNLKLLVATYFSDIRENLSLAKELPISGLHLDLIRGPSQLDNVIKALPDHLVVSLGVIDGRNIWKSDLNKIIQMVSSVIQEIGEDRIFIAPSCSLLNSPVDLDSENDMDDEMKSWLSFAHQKLEEICIVSQTLTSGVTTPTLELEKNMQNMESRKSSPRIHKPKVKSRVLDIGESDLTRTNNFPVRKAAQQTVLSLPKFPTTTIGSFPQTPEIRKARADYKAARIDQGTYNDFLKEEIANALKFQEEVGLDVLVHGEPERNDMVEYFGEQLEGFTHTSNGWVQSYGSRCVKPPVIFGDVERMNPMTVAWSTYAQSLTKLPVKGMLTGPVTILQWSFVRDDQPRLDTCRQIALAVRDEVIDLESAGIKVIQIDEPALREGFPLRKEDWDEYLRGAVDCFRLASSGVDDSTQIHTHMCYAEFNDIINAIVEMDADVISMETSRSDMELLDGFSKNNYPMDVGPGVYDIHSPRIVGSAEMQNLLDKALIVLAPEQLWVNPDCGLKTRRWEEVKPSLQNMVEAAKYLRSKVS